MSSNSDPHGATHFEPGEGRRLSLPEYSVGSELDRVICTHSVVSLHGDHDVERV